MQRIASAAQTGGLKQSKSSLSTQCGVPDETRYGFNTRSEDGLGTNPEERVAFDDIATLVRNEGPLPRLLNARIALAAKLHG